MLSKNSILKLFEIAVMSRSSSILGRKEVLTGKAKFGIFGDGKEIPQLAMSLVFQTGDWRSGYYRDQTFMMAAGLFSPEEFFAQLYGDTDTDFNPSNSGRLMNNHFSTHTLDKDGNWLNLAELKNVSADISPTAGQMPRALGLALASKMFRNNDQLHGFSEFSLKGNEVSFVTIGDASTSEGHFFETVNAAAVLQVPLAISVWDDGYGISVSRALQTAKDSISEALAGFQRTPERPAGIEIFTARAWNFEELVAMYEKGTELCRTQHVPVLFHITECTQPQGHSTSGSHERYKSKERLEWEQEFDGIKKFREWIIQKGYASADQLEQIEKNTGKTVKEARNKAWNNVLQPVMQLKKSLQDIVQISDCHCEKIARVEEVMNELDRVAEPIRKDVISSAKKILRFFCRTCTHDRPMKNNVMAWLENAYRDGASRYSSHLYSETEFSALKVPVIPIQFDDQPPLVPGREILRDNFDALMAKYPEMLAFGEDVGGIGGVNQTWEGLQKKFGELRVFDTGIREATIVGQAIGMAMRGLRPVAEIQYFDYLLYGLELLSDDLATLRYRTKGFQKAPAIISTRGHRLEGIWHSGSALSMVINSIRGMYVIVPRDMTRAAAFYNTMMQSDDPALIIEPLNGYRIREQRPSNFGEFTLPLGVPEILKEGRDITIVTYGSCVKIAQEAIPQLEEFDISVELIDVQTLLPFDINHVIYTSLRKTGKVLFFDEDLPGGATAFMMHQVLEVQRGYFLLDAEPKCLTAKEHRPAYGTDGDYFSNPNAEDVFETVYAIMHEYKPSAYPKIY
jgi:2-oxoisovalerate dehydrogenase E1 component